MAVLDPARGELDARRAAERQLDARQRPRELAQGVRRQHGALGVWPDDGGGEAADQAVAGHLQQPTATLGVAGDVGDDERRVQAAIGGWRVLFLVLSLAAVVRRGELGVQNLRQRRLNGGRLKTRVGRGFDERASRGVVLLAALVAPAPPALRRLAHQAVHAVERVEHDLGALRVRK